ncbi:MAG TPA: HAD-IC family P-type ATPase, partial [Myxococcota bacterium]|nr:HAD-IC family P-type ATPase [Myxococcota bacterium]
MKGLTSKEAAQRLEQFGPNLVKEKPQNRLLLFLKKFYGPIPWMLELTIVLQLVLHKYDQALIILLLLIINALISFIQEDNSNKAIRMLKKHLAIKVRALRDGQWQMIPAENVVPGDIIHLKMGDISSADTRISEGKVSLDQSVLTGESLPVEKETKDLVYSGATVKKGEATGEVVATGKNTFYGKTVSLLQLSATKSHITEVIYKIVKNLVIVDCFFALVVFIFALFIGFPLLNLTPFILMLLVASVPVALPTMFSLTTAVGALKLTKYGVLVTRLNAIEEAAMMDVLCVDKTGTITQNALSVRSLTPFLSHREDEILHMAALASDEASQDPI